LPANGDLPAVFRPRCGRPDPEWGRWPGWRRAAGRPERVRLYRRRRTPHDSVDGQRARNSLGPRPADARAHRPLRDRTSFVRPACRHRCTPSPRWPQSSKPILGANDGRRSPDPAWPGHPEVPEGAHRHTWAPSGDRLRRRSLSAAARESTRVCQRRGGVQLSKGGDCWSAPRWALPSASAHQYQHGIVPLAAAVGGVLPSLAAAVGVMSSRTMDEFDRRLHPARPPGRGVGEERPCGRLLIGDRAVGWMEPMLFADRCGNVAPHRAYQRTCTR